MQVAGQLVILFMDFIAKGMFKCTHVESHVIDATKIYSCVVFTAFDNLEVVIMGQACRHEVME